MEAKSNIRRLLAGSSLLALLGASHSALAAGGVTITGSTAAYTLNTTTDFIKVTSGGWVLGDLTVGGSGEISLDAAGTSFAGIEVNSGSVGGTIVNQNLIEVSALSTGLAVGIKVHGSNASVGGGIQNDGTLRVTGQNEAAGILVYGSDLTIGDDIVNGSAAALGIQVTAHQAVQSGTAVAGGIIVNTSESDFTNDIVNNGGINISATQESHVIDTAPRVAEADGNALAVASGMGISGYNSFAGAPSTSSVDLFEGYVTNNEDGLLFVQASALSSHIATASGSESNLGLATAAAQGIAGAEAYGMFATALTISGGLDNSGTVGVIGKATSINQATAHGVEGAFPNLDGDALASASGEASSYATAMQAEASLMSGSLTNRGILDAKARAVTTNTATADSTINGNVTALASGNAEAFADGLYVGVHSFGGDIINTSGAEISALATAMAHNSAVVDVAGESANSGYVSVQGGVHAAAAGMDVSFDSFVGNIVSHGDIDTSAQGIAVNVATVNVGGPATAIAGLDGSNVLVEAVGARISGEAFYASGTGISFGAGGSIDVFASGQASSSAKATGTSFVRASEQASSIADADGLYVSLNSLNGAFVNSGAVTVTGIASAVGDASAKATGSGTADAYAENYALANGVGVDFNADSLVGNFVNSASGAIDVTLSASVDATAKATAVGSNSAYAESADQVVANAGGLSFKVDRSAIGNITNNAIIDVAALASTESHATATALGRVAEAAAHDTGEGSFAQARGMDVSAYSLVGNFLNTGDVTSTASLRKLEHAVAHGGDAAGATADAGSATAGASGVSVVVDSSLIGSVSNGGTLTVSALVSTAGYASADATDGSASVSVAGFVRAHGYGFVVGGESISGNVINSGDIAVTAVAGDYNGSLLAESSGFGGFFGSIFDDALSYATGSSLNVVGLGGAIATGSSLAFAQADGRAYANASGFATRFDSVGGDVSNSGDIHAGVIAVTTNEAHATVESSGIADASASGRSARGQAIGVSIEGNSVGGSITNSSLVGSIALAGSFNIASASGTALASSSAHANAMGSAFATAIGIAVDVTSLMGGFTNTGAVNAHAAAATVNQAGASVTQPDGIATANAQDINLTVARATGVSLSGDYLGSFSNLDSVSALASALSLNAAEAHAAANGNSGTVATAYGDAYASAHGIELNGNAVADRIANLGPVDARAYAFILDTASASGNSVEAEARHGTVRARAVGIDSNISSVGGGFSNAGVITAYATAGGLPVGGPGVIDELSPFAMGIGDFASATGQSYAGATVGEGSAIANATGINFSPYYADSFGVSDTSFLNGASGSIHAGAFVALTNIAEAHAAGTANASAGDDEEGVSSRAAGILISANSMNGNLVNNGSINASAAGSLVNSASADSNDLATAHAYGSSTVQAYGLLVGDGMGSLSIAGDVINTGDIEVKANAFLANLASASADYAVAYAGMTSSGNHYDVASATASGLSLYTDSLAGNVSNSGAITVSATASAIGSAHATGGSYGLAGVANYANAYAFGLNIEQNSDTSIPGSVSNSGSITVSANALSVVDTFAEGSSSAYAYGYGGASAQATGISIAANIDGDFVNASSGMLDVSAIAIGDISTGVSGAGESSAVGFAYTSASAFGIVFGGESDFSIAGNVINHAGVTAVASASLQSNVSASTTGDGYATAYAIVAEADAHAGGIYVGLQSIGGDFYNDGAIDLTAIAHTDASVTASGNGARARGKAAAIASATGIDLDVTRVFGSVINDGAITVQAKADTNSRATATGGDYGTAYAAADGPYNTAYAEAAGLIADITTLYGDFANEAAVTVNASATARANTSATGVSGAFGTAVSYADAQGVGVALNGRYLSSFGGYIANSSTIDVSALALATAALLAAATGGAYASANADATGFSIGGSTLIAGDLVNDGSISVNAVATASAEAGDATGESDARAYADAGGFGAHAPTIAGGFINTSDSLVEANATAKATAEAYAGAYANAVGVDLYTSSFGGNIVNAGSILAHASADVNATGASFAVGRARATAMQVYVSGIMDGQVSNSGNIVSTAVVNSMAIGTGNATALGLSVDVVAVATGHETAFYNSGLIKASATAPDAAYATGAFFAGRDYAGDFVNEGTYDTSGGTVTGISNGIITAKAVSTDGGSATAVGLRLRESEDGSANLLLSLYNDGLISAVATADNGTAAATGILLENGAYITGGITNSGVIEARATGTSATAVAINLDDAGGSEYGTTIRQVGQLDEDGNVFGGIYGDIRSNNGYADVIDWTGGAIEGDLHGDTSDTLNVFAGSPSIQGAFVFDGNINASASDSEGNYTTDASRFGVVSVGTGHTFAQAVSLEVSGNMYLGDLNVHHNATLIVDPTAQINASNVTIDGSSGGAAAVQWNIKPSKPQNGTIVANSVTIGSGAKSLAYGQAGLFKSENDFWVIQSDGLNGVFANADNAVNGTVTPLGTFLNGLYTVSDYYDTTDEEGYHITVNRIAPSAIPGLTTDGENFADYLDQVLDYLAETQPESDLSILLGQVLTGTPEEFAHAVNELSGHQNGDLLIASLGSPSKLMEIIFSQLGSGDFGNTGFADIGSMVRVADNKISAAPSMNDAGPQYAVLGGPASYSRPASAWVRVFGSWSKLDSDPTVGAKGFTSSGGGVIVGGDYRFSDTFKAGIAAGYQKSQVDFGSNGGNADIQSYSLNAYGRFDQGPLYINGMLGVSRQTYDMTRYYTPILPAPTYSAHRDPNGTAVAIAAEVGYGFDMGGKSTLTPFLGFLYAHTKIDGSTETGTGPANLTVSDQSADTASSRLGIRWSKTFGATGGTQWAPVLELGWKHEFADENPTTTASLAGIPGGSYTVNGAEAPTDLAILGVGLNVKLTDAVDGTVQYNGDFGDTFTNSTASLRLRMKF